MGRKALKLEKIEDKQKRTVTFCKRSKGLFKKAKSFCDAFPGAQIAVITFSPLAGKPYTWASTDSSSSSSSSSSVDCIVDRFLLENTKSLGVIQDKGCLQSDDEDKNQCCTSMISEDFEGVPKLDDQSINVCDDQNKHGFEEDHQLLVTEENHPINNHGYKCESSICDVNFATTAGSIDLDIDQTMNSCGLDFSNQVITSTEGDLFLQMNEYSLDDLLLTKEEEAYLEGTTSCSGTNYQMLLSNSSLPPMLNDGTNGLAWSQGNSEIDEMLVTLPQEVFSIDEILASLDD